MARPQTPFIFWPFVALWSLVAAILGLVGRTVGVILALVLMIVGFLLTLTIILAPAGIPLIILGFLLLLRSLF